MVHWRDNLLPASFKGVPFKVRGHTASGGKSNVRHEYPKRDPASHEEIRMKTRVFNINGYVLGTEYFEARNALQDALESPGAGILNHPYLGQKVVEAMTYRIKEGDGEGGIAYFTMTFEETSEDPVPVPEPDYDAEAEAAAYENEAAAMQKLLDEYDPVGPDFILEGMIKDLTSWAEEASNLISTIPEYLSDSSVGEWVDLLADADQALAGLGYSIDGLGSWIDGKINGLSNLDTLVRSFASFNVLMEMFKWGDDSTASSAFSVPLDPIPLTTGDREQQRKNRDAYQALVRRAVLSEAARAGLGIEYASRDEADAIAGRMSEVLDEEIFRAGDSGDDIGYEALTKLRVKFNRSIHERAGQLPIIIKWKVPPAVYPALVLAYRRYEDVEREEEIVLRNLTIYNPAFLPQGVELEILNA